MQTNTREPYHKGYSVDEIHETHFLLFETIFRQFREEIMIPILISI